MRLIDADGSNKGVVETRAAIDLARSKHLDLIEVAPNADPPVCRIFDFGRFIYEREKKEREAKKQQKTTEVKGVRLRPKTSDHHLSFKIRAARRFLESGNKVKITLKFKGREDRLLHVAQRMMSRVTEECADIAVVEVYPTMEAKTMLVVLAPTQATIAAAHLRATQDRVEAERQADFEQGFVEEIDNLDEDEDGDEAADENDGKVAESVADGKIVDMQQKKALDRKQASRDKRQKVRNEEQWGLP